MHPDLLIVDDSSYLPTSQTCCAMEAHEAHAAQEALDGNMIDGGERSLRVRFEDTRCTRGRRGVASRFKAHTPALQNQIAKAGLFSYIANC